MDQLSTYDNAAISLNFLISIMNGFEKKKSLAIFESDYWLSTDIYQLFLLTPQLKVYEKINQVQIWT